jgi:hypothetical protein
MTPQSIFLGLAAGFISAIVFASATAGPMLSRLILFLLTPFSLYLAGLGLGFGPLLIGSAAATAIILFLSNPLTALAYAASQALPAIVLTRLTLTAREEDGKLHWYPLGRIIISAALISGALSFVYLALQGADIEALTKAVRPEIENFAKSLASVPGGAEALGETQIGELTSIVVASLPGAVSLSLMITALASLWLAGRVTLASGRLLRPWPDFSRIELPLGSAVLLVAATVLSFTSDRMWLLSDGLRTSRPCGRPSRDARLPMARVRSHDHLCGPAHPVQARHADPLAHRLGRDRLPLSQFRPARRTTASLTADGVPSIFSCSSTHSNQPHHTTSRRRNHASHPASAHRSPRPDGRRRQRQERLCAQLPAAAEKGAARDGREQEGVRQPPRSA